MRAALLVVIATIMASVVAPPAQADTTATISSPNQRIVDRYCGNYVVVYDLNIPAGVTEWTASITADSKDDLGYLVLSILSDAPAGERAISLCPGDDLTYDLEIDGTYMDAAGGGLISGRGTLQLKPALTRTKLSVSTTAPRFNQPVRFFAEAQMRSRYDYIPLRTAVQMQVRKAGRWVHAPKLDFFTSGNGKDTEAYRWNLRGAVTFRLVTPPEDIHARSVSNTVTVRTHG